MWLSRPSDTTGVHALVTAGYTNTSVTIYEGNSDGHCKVMLNTYTFAQFRNLFDEVVKTVAHDFSGTVAKLNAIAHTVQCAHAGCAGYCLVEHSALNPGEQATCVDCGYVGAIYKQSPLTAIINAF